MIKFAGAGAHGQLVIGLGVVRKNIEMLEQGKPLVVRLQEVGGPKVEIFVYFGETEEALVADLEKDGIQLPPVSKNKG